jgi:hypothetical protein
VAAIAESWAKVNSFKVFLGCKVFTQFPALSPAPCRSAEKLASHAFLYCGLSRSLRSGSALRRHLSATKQRKEPLENASHVRNAVARFKQVKGVTEAERRAAWKRIQPAAKRYGVELEESD